MENEFFNEELKYELLNYINENSFNKLISNTVLKLETNLVSFTIKIHSLYNKSNPINKRILREFWDCFPNYFWDRYFLQNSYWKILFEQYIQDFGFKNLRKNTLYKNKNIGLKLYKLRKRYTKSTFKQQQKMRDFWDCIPLYFWNEINDKFKKLFIKFIKNKGFEKLSYNIYKNSNSKLGLKAYKIHKKYKKNHYFKRMELKKYWDCFPDDFFGNRYLKNIEWKILFRDFFKENELDHLNRSTIYKNKYIGNKANFLINHYYKSMNYKQQQIKKFWNCFPQEFWNNKNLYSDRRKLKNSFFIIENKKAFYEYYSDHMNKKKEENL